MEGHLYDNLLDSIGLLVETLSPDRFVLGARSFLESIGLNEGTDVYVNGKQLQGKSKDSLMEAIDLCNEWSQGRNRLPREIDVNSYGTHEPFLLWTDVFYARKHRRDQPAVEAVVRAIPTELGPNDGESPSDYKNRMEAQDSKKKALFSDLVVRLSDAFPGVSLQLFERIT
jgi:hypothetical protein